MTPIPVTLASAIAALILNMWLGGRIAKYRGQFKVSVGDGGHEPLLRRMRAQANYVENAPFFLILLAALELSDANREALAIIAVLFFVARISHAVGMDAAEQRRWRMYGMMGTTLAIAALGLWGIVILLEALSRR